MPTKWLLAEFRATHIDGHMSFIGREFFTIDWSVADILNWIWINYPVQDAEVETFEMDWHQDAP